MKNRAPSKKGISMYYYKNNGFTNQNLVLYRKDAKGTETVFFGPQTRRWNRISAYMD
jgi:prolyl oligopeptidase